MTSLRLAIVSPDPTDNSQGVERFCHSLASSLAGRGIDPSVISRRDFNEGDFDVVLTNVFERVKTNIPRIHVYHGCHIPQIARSHAEASIKWRAKFMAEAGFREVRAGIGASRVSVSNSCAREIRRWYGLRSNVISNGIDTDVFTGIDQQVARRTLGLPLNQKLALFVGRPEWRKRPDIALAAARKHGYEMLLASGRPYDGMRWLGKMRPESLSQAMSAADVILMPTQYEACSLALLEALAVGTPVVTTDAGWVPDLIAAVPGYSALVSSIGDSTGFSNSLGRLPGLEDVVARASAYVRENNGLDTFGRNWAKTVHGSRRMRAQRSVGSAE